MILPQHFSQVKVCVPFRRIKTEKFLVYIFCIQIMSDAAVTSVIQAMPYPPKAEVCISAKVLFLTV